LVWICRIAHACSLNAVAGHRIFDEAFRFHLFYEVTADTLQQPSPLDFGTPIAWLITIKRSASMRRPVIAFCVSLKLLLDASSNFDVLGKEIRE
jgi:hypothetical protein